MRQEKRQIMTALGPIEPEDLGVCMAHEHILFDFTAGPYVPSQWASPDAESVYPHLERPLSLADRTILRRDPFAIRDNLRQTSVDLAVRELEYYRGSGGRSIVDSTPINQGRMCLGLKEVAHRTGLHVIASTRFYIEAAHRAYVSDASEEELAQVLIGEIREGMDGTDVRPGRISDFRTSAVVSDNEAKCLRAATFASLDTGISIGVHLDAQGSAGLDVVRILTGEGVPVDRIVLEHVDEQPGLKEQLRLADTGCFVQYDTWGMEIYWGPPDYEHTRRDKERAAGLANLVRHGYLSSILVSQDVCLKQLLREYGGEGYSSFLEVGVGFLRREGLDDEAVRAITVDNPARALSMRVG